MWSEGFRKRVRSSKMDQPPLSSPVFPEVILSRENPTESEMQDVRFRGVISCHPASRQSQEPAHPGAGTQCRGPVLYNWERGLFLGSCPESDSVGLKGKPFLRLKEGKIQAKYLTPFQVNRVKLGSLIPSRGTTLNGTLVQHGMFR